MIETDILRVLALFARFSHPPTQEEIHAILAIRCSRNELATCLGDMIRKKTAIHGSFTAISLPFGDGTVKKQSAEHPGSQARYTLPQYSIRLKMFRAGQTEWRRRMRDIGRYINIIKHIPWIRFVSLSGSAASGSMKAGEDLDLFMVTRGGCLWRGRFAALAAASFLGMKKPGGICLNLLFDETDLRVPRKKQSAFVARELRRILPLLDKDGVYDRLLAENPWTGRFLPNLPRKKPPGAARKGGGGFWDRCFGFLQERRIRRNRTFLMMTPTQLWLFKNDYEKSGKNGSAVSGT